MEVGKMDFSNDDYGSVQTVQKEAVTKLRRMIAELADIPEFEEVRIKLKEALSEIESKDLDHHNN